MRDTLVAVDTGFIARGKRGGVLRNAAATLFGKIHEVEVMTVAAFLRITVFHA